MSFEQESGLNIRRVESLADGIFAISMTLLAFNLIATIPDSPEAVALSDIYGLQWHIFFNYFLSFILLAIFWITHHRHFHRLKRTDERHLWINIFTLMFVALIPFSADLIGDYPNDLISNLVFSLNLFIVGTLFFISWIYSTYSGRLTDVQLEKRHLNRLFFLNLVVPVVSLVAIMAAFVNPGWSTWAYLPIPVIMVILKK